MCGSLWGRNRSGAQTADLPWDELLPTHQRIVIDAMTFIHWYDYLSDRACGVNTSSR